MVYIYNNIALVLLLLWVMVSASFSFSNLDFFIGFFILLIGVILNKLFLVRKMKEYGRLMYAYSEPQPLTTIVDSLYMENYTAKDIKEVDLISYELGQACVYSQKTISKIIELNENVQFNIIGYGLKSECETLSKNYSENLSYFPINERKTEHKNLIYMNDGKTFLWYEPYHKMENGKHFFKKGGYFIEPNKKALESIQKEILVFKEQSKAVA